MGRSLLPWREVRSLLHDEREPDEQLLRIHKGTTKVHVFKMSFYVFLVFCFFFRNGSFLTFQWTEKYFLKSNSGKNATEDKTAKVSF